jgi:hypothetical protein
MVLEVTELLEINLSPSRRDSRLLTVLLSRSSNLPGATGCGVGVASPTIRLRGTMSFLGFIIDLRLQTFIRFVRFDLVLLRRAQRRNSLLVVTERRLVECGRALITITSTICLHTLGLQLLMTRRTAERLRLTHFGSRVVQFGSRVVELPVCH